VRLSPSGRRLWLTTHIGTSVGWLGAVVTSLALAVIGVTSTDPELVRSVYVTLELIGWMVLVPFSLGSLGTGLVQSLGTRWGLLRHYWVIVKLIINLSAAVVLFIYMGTLERLAQLARRSSFIGDLAAAQSPSPVLHSALALLLLIGAMVLSVYKPKGVTRRGMRHAAQSHVSERLDDSEALV
jgi:hypothetical protein